MPSIPCHLIAGPLGVGKTTAIQDYLLRHAARQRVGVLVNDAGPFGLDGTMLASEAPGARVLTVPGGCICCTMLANLGPNIEKLIKTENIDRLIVEPSGLASPALLVDYLRDIARKLGIEIRPVIVMLNAAGFDERMFEMMPYFHVFAESADVLVFNRCDKATPQRVEQCKAWAAKLDPPKMKVLTTQFGQLPDVLFEITGKDSLKLAVLQQPHEHHEHNHSHDHGPESGIHAGGFTRPPELTFDATTLLANMIRICHQGIDGATILRLKGVFKTTDGWQAIQIANQEVTTRDSAHRRDSRMDWIARGGNGIDEQRMYDELTRPAE